MDNNNNTSQHTPTNPQPKHPNQSTTHHQIQLYTQLFKLQKIRTVDHNTSAKITSSTADKPQTQSQNNYKCSNVTQMILNKIQMHREQPWKLLNSTPQLIMEIVEHNQNTKYNKYQKPNEQGQKHYIVQGIPHFKNPQSIYIGQGTLIEHGAMITGPCLIGNNCEIRKGAYIRGGAIICDGSLVGNSSQLKNVILMDICQIAHFNYIGDSILGVHAHFAAGAITSNYKLDGSQIKVAIAIDSDKSKQHKQCNTQHKHKHTKQQIIIKTGRNKFGAIVGHNTEIGCNVILNPGSLIGRNSILYPLTNWRGYLAANKIVKLVQEQQVVDRI